eukprot:1151186-Pelagomonas_calceolata.AAC.6
MPVFPPLHPPLPQQPWAAKSRVPAHLQCSLHLAAASMDIQHWAAGSRGPAHPQRSPHVAAASGTTHQRSGCWDAPCRHGIACAAHAGLGRPSGGALQAGYLGVHGQGSSLMRYMGKYEQGTHR